MNPSDRNPNLRSHGHVAGNGVHAHAAGHPARLDELLADRATFGLTDGERVELENLLASAGRPGAADDLTDLDLAAASIDRAMFAHIDASVSVPASLLTALSREGTSWCAGVQSARQLSDRPGTSRTSIHSPSSRTLRAPVVMGRRYLREWSGWIAAAACMAFAVFAWQNRAATPTAATTSTPSTNTASILGGVGEEAFERIQRYLGHRDDLVLVPIGRAAPEASGDVTVGEVLWSKGEGRGVARIHGLQPLSTPGAQYQLWIFDKARDQRFPVDGGLITVKDGETEVLIPIDPHVPVTNAAVFAVTVERAGGVVVSERKRMVAIGVAEGMAPPPVFEDLPQTASNK